MLKPPSGPRPSRPAPPAAGSRGPPQDPPLIEPLAELKMIRALQLRVNRRTDRYAKLIQDEQTDQPDLLEALQRLSEQEQRIYRVTRVSGWARTSRRVILPALPPGIVRRHREAAGCRLYIAARCRFYGW